MLYSSLKDKHTNILYYMYHLYDPMFIRGFSKQEGEDLRKIY